MKMTLAEMAQNRRNSARMDGLKNPARRAQIVALTIDCRMGEDCVNRRIAAISEARLNR